MTRTYLLLLLATLFWGGTAVAGKLVLQDVPPLTAGVLRYGITALLLLLLFRSQLPSPWALRTRDRWLLVWIGIFGTFLNHTFFFLALSYAPAAHGALILSFPNIRIFGNDRRMDYICGRQGRGSIPKLSITSPAEEPVVRRL